MEDESYSDSSSSSSSGFESGVVSSSDDSNDSESDTVRQSDFMTRSKVQIGDPNRSESAQLKAARKLGVQSSARKSL